MKPSSAMVRDGPSGLAEMAMLLARDRGIDFLLTHAVIFAGHGSVEDISRAELDAPPIGQKFEDTARHWVFHVGDKARDAGCAAAHAPVAITWIGAMNAAGGMLFRVMAGSAP
jgi:hypothetical protein